jgi:uncharacterized membrane protein YccC
MDRATRFKEAVKVGLAFVLVYFIALNTAWMNPYWAAFAVALIALPSAGQSIHKGLNRLAGTIPGCIAALVILSLTSQSRWMFLVLACAWVFFTTYMMLRSKNNTYMWNVAGFVCLIITLSASGSAVNIFEHAVARTVETAMGIVVYTLVTVFLWPQTNAGAIKKAAAALMATQAQLLRAGREVLAGQSAQENPQDLHAQETQQLRQFTQALQGEGSESFEVRELRHLWERLFGLSTAFLETFDRLQTGIAELARIDVNAALPDLQSFFDELDERFEAIQRTLGGSPAGHEPRELSLNMDDTALHGLAHIDRAALSVTKNELEKLDGLTASMLQCARDLAGEPAAARTPEPISPASPPASAESRGWSLPVFDLDNLRGAVFTTMVLVVAFLIWVFFDPPGHAGWYQFAGTGAMAVAGMQQLRATMLVKPFAVALALGVAVYVFIMPQLSTFIGLGSLLFLCMFINRYFFAGLAQLAGSIGIISMISIQNQQSYNFAAMANSYLFTVGALLFLFAMTYILRSPRPEKAVLRMLRRFFRSAEYLVSRMALEPGHEPSALERYKTDFYRHELQTLPTKIGAWGKAINHKAFPNNTAEQVQALVISLQTLVYRIEELVDVSDNPQGEPLDRTMGEEFRAWRAGIESTFGEWSTSPETDPGAGLQERLTTWLAGLEAQINRTIQQNSTAVLDDREGEGLYRLLGSFRGVSTATVAYAGIAATLDWDEWQEEVFS